MPWKECQVEDERLRFVARLLDGEQMAGLCKEFGISRKTGYKIFERYQEHGALGLTDRSRRPYRHAVPHSRGPCSPMSCGARISKANSCSPIGGTVFR